MTPYETPVFDPATTFSWTLRSAEIARRVTQRQHGTQSELTKLAGDEPEIVRSNGNGNGAPSGRGARFETPAFAPGIAFAWSLRSAEIARRQCGRRNRQRDLEHEGVLVAA
jgi:hypothetical protein